MNSCCFIRISIMQYRVESLKNLSVFAEKILNRGDAEAQSRRRESLEFQARRSKVMCKRF